MTLKSLKNNTKNTKNFASSSPLPCPRPQHFDTGGRIRPSCQLALAKGVAQVTCALPLEYALGRSPPPHLTIANIFTIGCHFWRAGQGPVRISKCPRALCPCPCHCHCTCAKRGPVLYQRKCLHGQGHRHHTCTRHTNLPLQYPSHGRPRLQYHRKGKGTGHRAMSQAKAQVTGPCHRAM